MKFIEEERPQLIKRISELTRIVNFNRKNNIISNSVEATLRLLEQDLADLDGFGLACQSWQEYQDNGKSFYDLLTLSIRRDIPDEVA